MTNEVGNSIVSGKAALAFIAIFLIAGVVATVTRGPYIDEFWTMVFADPANSLPAAWKMWSGDRGHPIGYVMAMRGYAEFIPQSVVAGRLFNLIPLAVFLLVALRFYRLPDFGNFVLMFGLLSLSLYFSIERFADQRSYFSAVMFLASIIVLVHGSFVGFGSKGDRALLIGLAILAGFTHYAIALAAIAVLVSGVVSHLAGGRKNIAAWISAGALGTAAAIGLSLANAAGYEEILPPYSVSMTSFAGHLAAALLIAALANPLLSLLAIRGIATLPQGWRDLPRNWRAILATPWGCAALALAFVVVGFTVLNALTHILVVRQTMAVSYIALALVATSCAHLKLRPMAWTVVSVSIFSIAISTALVARQDNFLAAVSYLKDQQASCDDYRIFPRFPEQIVEYRAKENARQRHEAISLGYAYVASKALLRLEPETSVAPFDPRCGGAVWIQRLYLSPSANSAELIRKLGLTIGEADARRARLRAFDGAAVIEIPPTRPSTYAR